MALKYCAEPRCPQKVTHGKCPAHTKEQRSREDRYRGSARERGYTPTWDKASRAFKVRYPLCGMRPGGQVPVMSACYTQGRTTPSTQTDHVVPHKGDHILFWDEHGNWQALCDACHLKKTGAGL